MSKAAFYLLWCFIFVLPLDTLTYLPVLGSIPRVVGLVASAVGIIHILARRRFRPWSWFHVFALLFVLWAGMSIFWSIDPEATQTRFMTYLQLAVLVWLIWEIAWSPERRRALLQAYVLGACVASVATMYNYLTGVPLDAEAARLTAVNAEAARVTALNADPNELGLTLVLGLPMAWYLSFSQRNRRFAWLWRLYLPLGITATLLTASRGAFLTGLVALGIIPWTLKRLRPGAKAALYGLAAGSLVLVSIIVPPTSLERIGSTRTDIATGYFGGRGAIWRAGLELAQEHPLAGVGAGAFEAAVVPTLQRERASHQVFLSILVEDGIVGLLLFLAMVAAVAKSLRHLPPLQQRFSIVLLLALAVGSLSLSWDHRKQFWFVLGVLAAQVGQRPAWRRVSPTIATRASGVRPGARAC